MDQDSELTLQVARGNRQAFLELYERHSARVYGLALRMMGEAMSAEEITQDVFVKLWTRADTFLPERGSFLGWLLTIARRAALDRIRLEGRRPALGAAASQEAWYQLPEPGSTTDEARWRSLHFSVADLPVEQRQVIELAYYYGLSQSQIADHMDIPLGTVKTRLRLGMAKLRREWLAGGEEQRSKGPASDV